MSRKHRRSMPGANARESRAAGPASAAAAPLPWRVMLEQVLFLALLSALVARLLMGESFEPLDLSFLQPDVVSSGPSPASTTWLDSLVLVLSGGALLVRLGRCRLAPSVVCGLAMLVLAVGLSSMAACKTRLALNAGASLVIAALAAVALAQLLRRPWMTHLLAAALLAACGTNAVKCIAQVTHEFELVREDWQKRKEALFAQGARPDDPMIVNFERRMNSRLAAGHIGQPNVAGGCLAAGAVALLGVILVSVGAVARRRAADGPASAAESETPGGPTISPLAALVIACALLGLLAVGLWLTDSLGALLAALGGVAVYGVLLWLQGRRLSAGRIFALLVAGYLGLAGAGVAYGLARGTLPNESLAFRWNYWQTALRAMPEAPLTGLGRLNFLEAYLRHKDPVATEEVRDTHNLWVTLLVELGPLGFMAGALLIGAAVYGGLRSASRPPPGPARPPTTPFDARNDIPPLIAVLSAGLGVLVVQLLFSGAPPDAYSLGLPFLLLLVAAFLMFQAVVPEGSTGAIMPLALASALLVLLLHSLVDFTVLVQAGGALLAGLTACAWGWGARAAESPPEHVPRVALAGLLALPVLHVALCAYPTGLAEVRLADWRAYLAATASSAESVEQVSQVLAGGWGAVSADPLDARPARVVGRTVFQCSQGPNVPLDPRRRWLTLAEAYARASAARCARETSIQRLLADITIAQSQAAAEAGDAPAARALLRTSLGHWEALIEFYPSDPRGRIAAAQAWARYWRGAKADGDPRESERAAASVRAHLRVALQIDAARKPDVTEKLTPAERAVVDGLLRELSTGGPD